MPHVTLKSIANNPDIKEGLTREEIDAAIMRHADTEFLYDQPYEDPKRLRRRPQSRINHEVHEDHEQFFVPFVRFVVEPSSGPSTELPFGIGEGRDDVLP